MQQSVLPHLANVSMGTLVDNPEILQSALRLIRTEQGTAKANRAYRLMLSMGKSMTADELAPTNPCEGIYEPVRSGFSARMLSPAQRTRIIALSLQDPALAPVGLMMETGIAVEECCALDWADVHIGKDPGLLQIRAHSETSRRARTIPLSQAATLILRTVMARSPAPNTTHVFLNKQGKPYQSQTLRGRIRKMGALVGVERLGTRALLSDFMTYAIQHGIDPIQLKDYLGLKKAEVILNYWQFVPRIH